MWKEICQAILNGEGFSLFRFPWLLFSLAIPASVFATTRTTTQRTREPLLLPQKTFLSLEQTLSHFSISFLLFSFLSLKKTKSGKAKSYFLTLAFVQIHSFPEGDGSSGIVTDLPTTYSCLLPCPLHFFVYYMYLLYFFFIFFYQGALRMTWIWTVELSE